MSTLTVEETLRRIEDRAAMLRYWADAGARHETPPPPDALSGLADALADIGELAAALPVRVLASEIPRERHLRRSDTMRCRRRGVV